MRALHTAMAVTAAGLLTGAVGWWQDAPVVVRDEMAAPAPASVAVVLGTAPLTSVSLPDLQQLRTFRGAAVDGMLRTDHRGELMIDLALRHWLDFYLSAQGEVALPELIELMRQDMRQLPEPGQQQALTLLSQYLGYLQALADYDVDVARRLAQPGMDDLEARFLWQQRLRREWLSPPVVAAFFAEEEQLDEYTLAARRLRRDGAEDEDDALAALEQRLPEPLQAMRLESRQLLTLRKSETRLRQQGAGSDDIQRWREQQYGREAAARLAELDQRQAQWQQRLQGYQRYRESLAMQELNEPAREQLLQTYRSRHFSATEQKRLNAALSLLAAEN